MAERTIRGIVFDFGNVICVFDNNLIVSHFSKYSSLPESEFAVIFGKSKLPEKYETGKITSDEFFVEMKKEFKLNISKPDFIKAYTDKFTPINPTYELIRKLKKRGYKLGLLSNTSEWDFEYGIRPIEIFKLFDAVTLSYVIGVKKPGKAVYDDIRWKLSLQFDALAYIDDIKEYVQMAALLGMKGVHHTPSDSLESKLIELGVCLD